MAGGSRRRIRQRLESAERGAQQRSVSRPNQRRRRTGRVSSALSIHPNQTPLELETVNDVVVLPTEIEPDYAHEFTPKKKPINRESWKSRQLHLKRREYQPCGCKALACDEKLSAEMVNNIREHFFGFREYNDQQKYFFL